MNATERSTLIERLERICFACFIAGLLAFPNLFFSAVPATRQAKTAAAYERANRMRTTLESLPENQRTKADYQKVIESFQEVVRLDPAYAKTPAALACVAELYEEQGRLFAADRYYLQAVKSYQFLVSQYPGSQAGRDALFTLGEIYRTDLENPEQAREAFQKFLDEYPNSSKAEEAQAKIDEIDQSFAKHSTTHPTPRRETEEAHRGSGLPEVNDVRRWVGPNYSRIVIGVGEEVKFETTRLSKPDRIVLDIQNARLSPALVGKTFPVEDGFLRQVRLGQFTPTITRVVLDVEKIDEYSVLPLPNPFRLVIDIHGAGTPAQGADQASKPPATGPVGARTSRSAESLSASQSSAGGNESPLTPAVQKAKPKRAGEATGVSKESEQTPPVETATVNTPATPPASAETETSETPLAKTAPLQPKVAPPTESGSRTLTRVLGLKIGRIVIDPGHGGHDTGTIGPTGLREKDVVLDVALRLKKLLERKAGCEVVMTRSDDTFIPLEERTAIANAKAADLFVSIHANASSDRSARGIETYFLSFTSNPEALLVAGRENATSQESVHQLQDLIKKIALTEKIQESEEFARQVQKEIYRRTSQLSGQQRDRGVKKAPFVVLIGANMPSVLAEISFLTNPRDEKSLRRSDYRQKVAEALYQGILDYVNNLGGVKVVQRAASDDEPRTGSKTGAEF